MLGGVLRRLGMLSNVFQVGVFNAMTQEVTSVGDIFRVSNVIGLASVSLKQVVLNLSTTITDSVASVQLSSPYFSTKPNMQYAKGN